MNLVEIEASGEASGTLKMIFDRPAGVSWQIAQSVVDPAYG